MSWWWHNDLWLRAVAAANATDACAGRARAKWRDGGRGARVLYTSGYTENAIGHQGRLDPDLSKRYPSSTSCSHLGTRPREPDGLKGLEKASQGPSRLKAEGR